MTERSPTSLPPSKIQSCVLWLDDRSDILFLVTICLAPVGVLVALSGGIPAYLAYRANQPVMEIHDKNLVHWEPTLVRLNENIALFAVTVAVLLLCLALWRGWVHRLVGLSKK